MLGQTQSKHFAFRITFVLVACSLIATLAYWYKGSFQKEPPRTSIAELRQRLAAIESEVSGCSVHGDGTLLSGNEGIRLVRSLLDSLPTRGVVDLKYEPAGMPEIIVELVRVDESGRRNKVYGFYVWHPGEYWMAISTADFGKSFVLSEGEHARVTKVYRETFASIRMENDKSLVDTAPH